MAKQPMSLATSQNTLETGNQEQEFGFGMPTRVIPPHPPLTHPLLGEM